MTAPLLVILWRNFQAKKILQLMHGMCQYQFYKHFSKGSTGYGKVSFSQTTLLIYWTIFLAEQKKSSILNLYFRKVCLGRNMHLERVR